MLIKVSGPGLQTLILSHKVGIFLMQRKEPVIPLVLDVKEITFCNLTSLAFP